ncbi:hypothetical protein TNCV_3591001 [Trichonephila clavipes]|nr:hypothetical protein TNCV_3591001 [Trichonephila clavipes]
MREGPGAWTPPPPLYVALKLGGPQNLEKVRGSSYPGKDCPPLLYTLGKEKEKTERKITNEMCSDRMTILNASSFLFVASRQTRLSRYHTRNLDSSEESGGFRIPVSVTKLL